MNKIKVFIDGKELNFDGGVDVLNDLLSSILSLVKEPENLVKDLDYYMNSLAEKWGWSKGNVESYLHKLYSLYPILATQMLLKEIAVDLDKNYDNHIKNSEHIYAISTINGGVVECDKPSIKTYKNFAAFRTVEDALFAKKVLRELLKGCFDD